MRVRMKPCRISNNSRNNIYQSLANNDDVSILRTQFSTSMPIGVTWLLTSPSTTTTTSPPSSSLSSRSRPSPSSSSPPLPPPSASPTPPFTSVVVPHSPPLCCCCCVIRAASTVPAKEAPLKGGVRDRRQQQRHVGQSRPGADTVGRGPIIALWRQAMQLLGRTRAAAMEAPWQEEVEKLALRHHCRSNVECERNENERSEDPEG